MFQRKAFSNQCLRFGESCIKLQLCIEFNLKTLNQGRIGWAVLSICHLIISYRKYIYNINVTFLYRIYNLNDIYSILTAIRLPKQLSTLAGLVHPRIHLKHCSWLSALRATQWVNSLTVDHLSRPQMSLSIPVKIESRIGQQRSMTDQWLRVTNVNLKLVSHSGSAECN